MAEISNLIEIALALGYVPYYLLAFIQIQWQHILCDGT